MPGGSGQRKIIEIISLRPQIKKPLVPTWNQGFFYFKPDLLGDRDVLAEVDVLDGLKELGPFFHRPLESLAAGNEPHTAGPLVDNSGFDRLGEVVIARSSPR